MGIVGDRLLAVFAHPDDETIMAGATMASARRAGHAVRCVTVTLSDDSRLFGARPDANVDVGAVRRAELAAALGVLGVTDTLAMDRPGSTVAVGDEQLIEELTGIIEQFAPTTILTNSSGAGESAGHAEVAGCVQTAARRARNARPPVLWHATRTPEWVERYVGPIKQGGGMATAAPATTRHDQLAFHLVADDDLLALKLRAVYEHASQVLHVASAMGDHQFAEAMREEHFAQADALPQ